MWLSMKLGFLRSAPGRLPIEVFPDALSTSWIFRDLLDTPHRKLFVYGPCVPPLSSFLTPARRDHIPYRVR